jgi:hypothetical protein
VFTVQAKAATMKVHWRRKLFFGLDSSSVIVNNQTSGFFVLCYRET